MERVLRPERFIVGCNNADNDLPFIYEQYLLRFECPILVMRYESAELAKISINFFWSQALPLRIYWQRCVKKLELIGMK